MDYTFLRLDSISKTFFGARVLSDITLEFYNGEIHSLVGENGAGKSTLMKIIAGAHKPSSGEMYISGGRVGFTYPGDAYREGIYLVQQEPSLFNQLSVAENIFMGIFPMHESAFVGIDKKKLNIKATEVLKMLNLTISPDELAGNLTIAHQQMVEIVKALVRDVKLLILDEPTSSLSVHEVQRLFEIIKKLKSDGLTILFISHRLEEVMELSDRVTILRDGNHVGTFSIEDVSQDRLVSLMVGRELALQQRSSHYHPDRNELPILKVNNISRVGEYKNISFEIYPGEVVGMAGLVGAGRTEIAESIYGITKMDTGEIIFNQHPVRIRRVRDAIEQGIVYIPEDRHAHGISLNQSLFENVTIPWFKQLRRYFLLFTKRQITVAEKAIKPFHVRMRDVNQMVRELSGGNQQKVVIAKWLHNKPKLIIFDEPTRGVDIGAKIEIHKIIDELAKEGTAVIVISSDLPEIIALSDRVLVVREGRITKNIVKDKISEEIIMGYATGVLSDVAVV